MIFGQREIDLGPLVELEKTTEYEPSAGESINSACEKLCSRATVEGRNWAMVFNGRRVVARPGESPRDALERWFAGMYA